MPAANARRVDLQLTRIGQAERDRTRSIPEFGVAAHRCTAALESVSGQIDGGGQRDTPAPSKKSCPQFSTPLSRHNGYGPHTQSKVIVCDTQSVLIRKIHNI